MLLTVAERVANAEVPEPIRAATALGALTALNKRNARQEVTGVRGIVAGDTFRRLIARTLAQAFTPEIEAATAPAQVAVGTRAGLEAAVHAARTALELDDRLVLVSLDGIGAFDHVSRRAMLERLDELPGARALLPFVRMFYAHPSVYVFETADGVVHEIRQGEGGEQGDGLMPALFSLGVDRAMRAIRARLVDGDRAGVLVP